MPKYNSIDNIPAKTFFDILKTKDYQLLKPKPKEPGLEQIFIGIYDDFFVRSDNDDAKEFLRLTNEIAFLKHKISVIKQTLHFEYYNPSTLQIRLNTIKVLNDGCGLDINADADFDTEVHRVLTQNVGWLNNDLKFAEAELQNIMGAKNSKEVTYWERLVGLSKFAPPNMQIRDNMFLGEFVEVEKAIIKYNKELKRK